MGATWGTSIKSVARLLNNLYLLICYYFIGVSLNIKQREGKKKMNKIFLVGRLAKEPKIFKKDNNTSAIITLAVDGSYNKETKETNAEFVDLKAFGRNAEILEQWATKGQLLEIEARFHNSNYQKDNTTIYQTDVIIDNFKFLSSGKKEDAELKAEFEELAKKHEEANDDKPF